MRRSEEDYAKKLEQINERVQQRPLLLEQDLKQKAVRELERKLKQAMSMANVTEDDIIRQQHDRPNHRVASTTNTTYSSYTN